MSSILNRIPYSKIPLAHSTLLASGGDTGTHMVVARASEPATRTDPGVNPRESSSTNTGLSLGASASTDLLRGSGPPARQR